MLLTARLTWALFTFLLGMLLETVGGGGGAGASGAGGGEGDPPAGGGGQGTTPDPRKQPKHSDEDVDKYKGTAREEGRTSTETAILERFKAHGYDSLDDVENVAKAYREAEREGQSELETARSDLATKDTTIQNLTGERDDAVSRADRIAVDSELRLALMDEGLDRKMAKKVVNDPDLEKPTFNDEGKLTEDSIRAYIDKAKEEWGTVFNGSGGTTPPPREPITPSPPGGGDLQNDPVGSYFDKTYGDPVGNSS